jgi:hypothetical protein
LRHTSLNLLLNLGLDIESRRSRLDNTSWRVNLISLVPKSFLVIASLLPIVYCIVLILFFLREVLDEVLDWLALHFRERFLAQEEILTLLLILVHVLVQHTVQLVPEHVKVVYLHVADSELLLYWL